MPHNGSLSYTLFKGLIIFGFKIIKYPIIMVNFGRLLMFTAEDSSGNSQCGIQGVF